MIYLSDDEFHEISTYIRKNYGVNLEKKRTLIEGRLGFYITTKGYNSYKEYFEYAKNDPTNQELANMINRLTTNHTYFMREKSHFEYYEQVVLPWIDNDLKENDLRLWSAGCSTGQEPYTLVMVTQDYLGHRANAWDSSILATDISEKALAIAKKGVYLKSELADVPQKWLDTYMIPVGNDQYAVNELLRKNVAYRNFNLLSDFQFKKPFQAIFCRNVMIYFDNDTKKRIVKKFYDSLIPGGYLFLGHSESLSTIEHDLKYMIPSVYRKE